MLPARTPEVARPARILATMDFPEPDRPLAALWPSAWLRPQWPAPTNVKAFCTSRDAGVSVAPYQSMNLGSHVGDQPEAVATNRRLMEQILGVPSAFLSQVHGTDVIELTKPIADAGRADGSWTQVGGLACTVMVADCLPLLLCTTDGSRVAALHAGWRGLAGASSTTLKPQAGVIESFLHAQTALGMAPARWMVWLGPCIGPTAFEVGGEVRDAFLQQAERAKAAFVPIGPNKWLADLALIARQRLEAAGVTAIYGNDSSAPWCTVGNPLRFFSHRRDRISGRFAAGVWLA